VFLGADTAGVVAGVSGLAGAALYVGLIVSGIKGASRTYSRSIVKRLKQTGRPVIVDVSARRGTWNPASKAEVGGRIFRSGRAEYAIDPSGLVHLRFRASSGPEEHFEGPVPEWHESPAGRRRRSLIRRFYGAYSALLLIGFGVAYEVSGGSVPRRLGLGLVGLLGMAILLIVVFTFAEIGVSIRTLLRDRSN
jgi:hypothetical protein